MIDRLVLRRHGNGRCYLSVTLCTCLKELLGQVLVLPSETVMTLMLVLTSLAVLLISCLWTVPMQG